MILAQDEGLNNEGIIFDYITKYQDYFLGLTFTRDYLK